MTARVVVVGCGFGGYAFLRAFRSPAATITLVSPRNYFLFTPLLPSAATGTVELRSIVEPARRRLRGVALIEGSVTGVDWQRRQVRGRAAIGTAEFELPFDHLVVAVGSEVATYGIPGVAEHAVPFASLEDARQVRRRVLEQFARAAVPGTPAAEIERDLRFVVCGGGPTGVEVAAELHDLFAEELRRAFPDHAPRARVTLVEAGKRLLAGFDDALADYAARTFRREGIELRVESPVRALRAGEVELASGETLRCGLVVWAAGSRPAPLVEALGVPLDPRGRIRADATLRVPSQPGLWALGDCAAVGEPPLPATAQVAQQQGAHLAGELARELAGRPARPFRFRSLGMLTYVGAGRALADLPNVKWSGRAAWWFWRSVYLTRLVSVANKSKVLFDWFKARLFGRDLARF